MTSRINIIDLFAGPGGLGEGFSSLKSGGDYPFKIRMSVEKEFSAHTTLTLRAFFRLLRESGDLRAYYNYVEGHISKDELIRLKPEEWQHAREETLGTPTALGDDNAKIHQRLFELKEQYHGEPWVVIGGPPCQAYSLVGRARNMGIKGYSAEKDHRHFLYQEYLKVLSIIQPDVFVMENVKGILSSQVNGERIFPTIRRDLHNPSLAAGDGMDGRRYRIYSFVKAPDSADIFEAGYRDDQDYIIRAEDFGVPQARHRVILLGVACDLKAVPACLEPRGSVNIEHVLSGLPTLRSKLSRQEDSRDAWRAAITDQYNLMQKELRDTGHGALAQRLGQIVENLGALFPVSSRRYPDFDINKDIPEDLKNWLMRERPESVLNHHSRGHMASDLGRYLFSAGWAWQYVDSVPKADDFPQVLAPRHANWSSGKFADRFRVQRYGRPATTVTSHISKDGHYFIHPDATQCRSLTVREAARIQTFPDNYFFEGNRTQQYVQVGNAVPPFLAVQLAGVVYGLLRHQMSQ
jgi:DNA (cytosine-5)-methyltransferase 1